MLAPPIFISYRRSDLSLEADWIYNFICTFFGDHMAFFDKQEIESGKRWDKILETSVSSAQIVFVLIGPRWLKEQDEKSGMRRLDTPYDWVRKEVETAIKVFNQENKSIVIPVLINGSKLPDKECLPEVLSELAKFQKEKALEFHISNYVEVSYDLYEFICSRLLNIQASGLIPEFNPKPFDHDKIPNPYEIKGFQLPEELRRTRPEFPFKGLEYFGREDARIFFGRSEEVGKLIDIFKKSPRHVIRLFGQSGVGKSSLLFAGLLPRLQNKGWNIPKPVRRDSEIPLGQSLREKIKELSQTGEEDSLIILDQVEEIITNPNKESPDELENLAKVISDLEEMNAESKEKQKKPIQIILSYRKEYDVEINAALKKYHIDSNDFWLQDLNESGMKEAITGLIRDVDLNGKYHLQIEKGLDDLIIKELLKSGKSEDTTPLLQILLRLMWDEVSKPDSDKRIFNEDLYKRCKSDGLIGLIEKQFKLITSRKLNLKFKTALESGLAVDMLNQFITEKDSAASISEEDILGKYDDDLQTTVKQLLQELVDAYLLIRSDKSFRLPHDTLAKAVRIYYNNSQLRGQRAARLLESKKQDFDDIVNNKKKLSEVEFSKADLEIIEVGELGMREWRDVERGVIENSRKKIKEGELELQERLNKSLEAISKSVINYSISIQHDSDYLRPVRLAEIACEVSNNLTSRSNLAIVHSKHEKKFRNNRYVNAGIKLDSLMCLKMFSEALVMGGDLRGNFFVLDLINDKILLTRKVGNRKVNSIDISANKKLIAVAADNMISIIDHKWKIVSSKERNEFGAFGDLNSVNVNSDLSVLAIATDSGNALIMDINLQMIRATLAPPERSYLNDISFSPDGKFLLCGYNDGSARLWNVEEKTFKTVIKHDRPVKRCAFAPNGKMNVTASEDGTAKILDLEKNQELVFDGQVGRIRSVEFSKESDMILTCAGDIVQVWKINGECHIRIQDEEFWPAAAAINNSSGEIIIGTSATEISIVQFRIEDILKRINDDNLGFLDVEDLKAIDIEDIDSSRPNFERLVYLKEKKNLQMMEVFKSYYSHVAERSFYKREYFTKKVESIENWLNEISSAHKIN